MSVEIDLTLCDQMIARVVAADAQGEPLSWRTGPHSDEWIKQRFGIARHKSVICTTLRHLTDAGFVRIVDSGMKASVIMGGRTRSYPIVKVLPA